MVDAHAMQHVDQILRRNVAGGGGREGTAANAAAAGVQYRDAALDGCIGVGEAGVAGVVEMRAQPDLRQRRAQRSDERAHLRRNGDADGVGHGDLVRLSGGDPLCQAHHPVDGHLALEGTAEGGRNGDLGANTRGASRTRDVQPGVHALVHARALVALAEAFAHGDGHADFSAAGGLRALEALAIEHQSDEARVAGQRRQRGQHRLGIGHLRHALGIHEARHFHAAQPGGHQAADELDLGGGRQHLRFALQAVARPDFNDLDGGRFHGREF